ncbi:putative lipid II flippase FtsW [Bacillus sp. ISL-18]|uniref:putative lipid II flippase FtsW n=1 Tax=Bacillus sp. ISL-18 TaxID=2819118 RepID=UPI001BE82D95|nr:putative lipid II flippase FtsW [Bacillus sp. ISL-18]MBT2655843.1 putative lipid II flippase FtsW [Bacillus sp. ISL-18]
MFIERIRKTDYLLVLTIICICFFGMLMVYSASYPYAAMNYDDPKYFFHKQFHSLCIGLVLMAITSVIPYRLYGRLSPILVVLSILALLMVLTPGVGVERNNSQRWLSAGPLIVQPTEAVKLAMIIYFAYIYSKKQDYLDHFWKGVMPPLFILGLVFFLILKQPDLGTATSILLPCGFILLCTGVRVIHLVLLGSISIGGIGYLAISAPYRLRRIMTFLNPFEDPDGEGFQLINSYEAIASGGVWGRGFGHSVQKLGYLPEAHTDFIMAIILEEFGVFGLLFITLSYLVIMYCGVRIALKTYQPFGKLLAIGLTLQMIVQAVFNLGAVSCLLPVTGIPLPFVSYGGSSLIFMLISSGILLNLSWDEKTNIHKKPS